MAYQPQAFDHVVVTWEDASSQGADQYSTIDSAKASYDPTIRKSHGLYIGFSDHKSGRRALIIATDDDRKHHEDEDCGGLCVIPVGMVMKIEKPRSNRKKKRIEGGEGV